MERFGTLDKEGKDLFDQAISDFEGKNVEGLHKVFDLVMGALETEYHRRLAQRWLKFDQERFHTMMYCLVVSRGPV